MFAAGEDAEEQARGLCRIFVELAESHLDFVLTASPEALEVIEAILACGAHPDFGIARMPFNFWCAH